MPDFGGQIRDARERLGLSPHRVAELIGRSSGTVRAWERGRTVPSDPVVITSLAAVLAIDESDLFVAAGLTPPGAPPTTTIEQELASIAPAAVAAEPSRSSVATDEHPAATDDDRTAVVEAGDAVSEFFGKAVDSLRQIPLPTFTRRDRQTPSNEGRARPAPVFAPVVQPPPASRSYLEDGDERWSYRLRGIWTAAGVGALGIALLWAGSRMLEAFGDAWDSLLAGL